MGFSTPQDKWFRTKKFQEYIMDMLNSNLFRTRGYVDSDRAISLYEKHLKKEIDIAGDIWKWINLELWYNQFIDEFDMSFI